MTTDLETDYSNLVQFLYACPVGLVEVLPDGSVGTINPHAMKLLLPLSSGLPATDFFALLEGVAPEIRQMVEGFDEKHGTICDGHRIFIDPVDRPGSKGPQVLGCTLVKLASGRYLATLSDISAQILQEKRLRQAEAWFSSLLEGIKDFTVVSTDVDGRIEGASPSIARQTGYCEADIIGQPISMFYADASDSEQSPLSEQLAIARRDGWHLEENWNERKNGERYWSQRLIAIRMETCGEGKITVLGYTVVLRNVTRQSNDFLELKRRLSTDQLTGAMNRGTFFETAERELEESRRTNETLGFVALDIDHFKEINDTHGHAAGDIVLTTLSKTCMAVLRPGDSFARMGGEEFAVLLPRSDAQTTLAVAERMRLAVEALAIDVEGAELSVKTSIGCTTSNETSGSVPDLLMAADTALYEAKREGRNRTHTTFDRRIVA